MTENELRTAIASVTRQLERLGISSAKAAETFTKTAQTIQDHINLMIEKEEPELPKEAPPTATEEEYVAIYDPLRSDWG